MAAIDIEKIKSNEKLRNEFINDYKPFIASCVFSIIHRGVEYGVDEELSIALVAFNHAIDKYDGRGSFLGFSKLVIKNRLYDYYRSKGRSVKTEPLYNEDESENSGILDKSVAFYDSEDDNFELKEEIAELNKMLKSMDIEFMDLVKISPKHKSKRKKLNAIARFVQNNEEAQRYFLNSHNLPQKLIEEHFGISRKNIEPYRKYIIAILMIANSDFYYLKEYLSI